MLLMDEMPDETVREHLLASVLAHTSSEVVNTLFSPDSRISDNSTQ